MSINQNIILVLFFVFFFSDEKYLDKVNDLDIEIDLPDFEPNNVFQTEAINNSLNNSFSLIHGPPGEINLL
jgi:hypothetical protein